jgi:hypothetical protein
MKCNGYNDIRRSVCENVATRFLYVLDDNPIYNYSNMHTIPRCEECFRRLRLAKYVLVLNYEEHLVYEILST